MSEKYKNQLLSELKRGWWNSLAWNRYVWQNNLKFIRAFGHISRSESDERFRTMVVEFKLPCGVLYEINTWCVCNVRFWPEWWLWLPHPDSACTASSSCCWGWQSEEECWHLEADCWGPEHPHVATIKGHKQQYTVIPGSTDNFHCLIHNFFICLTSILTQLTSQIIPRLLSCL